MQMPVPQPWIFVSHSVHSFLAAAEPYEHFRSFFNLLANREPKLKRGDRRSGGGSALPTEKVGRGGRPASSPLLALMINFPSV